MRRFAVLFVVIAVFGLTAVTAAAGTDPRVTSLQKQIATITKQVAALQSGVQSMQGSVSAFGTDQARQDDVDTCDFATLFKLSVVEYQAIAYLGGVTPDPSIVPISDDGACARLGLPSVTTFALTPSPFSALEQLLTR